MKNKIKIFIISFFLLSITAIAQPPIFTEIVDDETVPTAPIDGFLFMGLIAGVGIGYKKLKS